jgi:hypothetical protein
MGVDTGCEVVVFVKLRRGPGSRYGWAKYRALLPPLAYSFPIAVSENTTGEKFALFLKRHEHVWSRMFELLDWEIVERHEVSMSVLEEALGRLREAVEAFGRIELPQSIPQPLAKVKPTVALGPFRYGSLLRFVEAVRKRFWEYAIAPQALKKPVEGETRFHKFLRTSEMAVLKIVGTYRPELMKRISEHLYELLWRGVIPIDYSYDSIIVARRVYKNRYYLRIWRSAFGYDPIEVLKGFESRYEPVLPVKELVFEERDIGWGLRAVPAI